MGLAVVGGLKEWVILIVDTRLGSLRFASRLLTAFYTIMLQYIDFCNNYMTIPKLIT